MRMKLPYFLLKILMVAVLSAMISLPATAQSKEYDQALSAYQNQNFTDAESIWTELANLGNVNAQYAMGVMHLRQEASDASPAAAFSWFEKASNEGHPTAMFNLGVAYWEGTGVEENRKAALDLWEQSALKGDSGAQFNLGLAYYIGEEREADLDQAAKWIDLAADQKHPEANRILKLIQSERQQQQPSATTDLATIATTSSDQSTNQGANDTSTSNADGTNSASSTDSSAAVADDVVAATDAASAAAVDESPKSRYWKTINRSISVFDKPNGIAFREIPPGTPLEVTGQDGGWARVTLPDGIKTWVFRRFIDINGGKGVINTDAVRVRPNPSTDNNTSPPLGKYEEGVEVTVLDGIGDWIQIRAPKSIGVWLRVDDIVQYQETEENRQKEWKQAQANGA